ncbi:MAG: LamG-like jellyroll fold domain-containing protein, partial [Gammaproteobacteria bacterium]
IWYHAVATYDGTMMRLYLNGLPVGVQLQPGTIDTNPAASVAIGAHPSLIGPAAHLDGVIDEVAVFDRALSPTEVQVLHQAYTQLDFDIDAHRVTESWTESGSNWDTLDGSTPWASGAGGSYDPAPVTSLAADTTGWYEFDLRTLVQEWIDGINANEGVQLNTTAVANGLQVVFDSREGANVPELNVEYTQ